ncbi:MAG TPA: hypothetical protein VJK54_02860, partial [Chthoniobacterales bacterium]|nr:hypothetical protein [Chthoniobacterales bacterium]
MKKLSLLVTLVLVNLLHPTVTFAMDSKMIAKATKEIAKDIEKLSEDEQNFGSELDGSVKGRGGSSQQAFPSSSSRSGGSSFATLLGPSATVTDFASSSSLSGLNAPSFPNTRGDSIKIVQNLDDLRTSIGQIIKSTLDKENRTLA